MLLCRVSFTLRVTVTLYRVILTAVMEDAVMLNVAAPREKAPTGLVLINASDAAYLYLPFIMKMHFNLLF
jgi:hypothetical protein